MLARTSLFFGLLFTLGACSGAAETELFDNTPSSQESSFTEPSPAKEEPSHGLSGDAPSTGSGSSHGAPSQAAPPDDPKEPAPEEPKCTAEAEPNDKLADATAFTTCVTGAVSEGDVDYVKITAPANAGHIDVSAKSSARVQYRVTLNGFVVQSWTEKPSPIIVVGGATYGFQVRSASTGPARTYELGVEFSK